MERYTCWYMCTIEGSYASLRKYFFQKKKINMTPKLNSKLLINKFDVPQNKGEICPENLLSLNVSQQI